MSYNPLLEEQVAESVAETDTNAVDGDTLIAPKSELPEAPLSFNIIGYYKGFRVGTTIRLEQNGTIPTSKVINLVEALIELGFKPSWNETTNKETLTPKTIDLSIDGPTGQGGKCPIHGTPLVWKSGISKTTNNPYAFWSCPTKNADGSYCKSGMKK